MEGTSEREEGRRQNRGGEIHRKREEGLSGDWGIKQQEVRQIESKKWEWKMYRDKGRKEKRDRAKGREGI
jgi:hypothetical protein